MLDVRHPVTAALLLALAALLAPSAHAAPAPVAVVVSGGISQGAYLAGQMYALTEYLKSAARESGWSAPEDFPPLVVTGASAGSISATLLAAELGARGLDAQPVPEDSLYFRVWVPMGLTPGEESLDAPASGDSGLLNRVAADRAIAALDYLERADPPRPWAGPVRVGMQTTRLVPLPDSVGPTVQVNEAFAFELQGDLSSPVALQAPGPWPASRPARLTDLAEIARISSAFPVAFSPVWLPCDRYEALSYWPERPCNSDGKDAVLLFDGGVYENNPVDLAWALIDDRSATVPFVYLDPDLRGSPRDPRECSPMTGPQPEAPWDQVLALAGTVGGTFRVQSVAGFARDRLGEVSLLPICQTTAPVSGELGAFFGFFERSVRAWDFYAGMIDARRFLLARAGDLGLPRAPLPAVDPESPFHAVARAMSDPRVAASLKEGFSPDPGPAERLAMAVADDAFGDPPPLERLVALPLVRPPSPEGPAFSCWGLLERDPGACRQQASDPAARGEQWAALEADMWGNLRTLTWLSLTRVLWQRPPRGAGEQLVGLEWLIRKLSAETPCPQEGCAPFRFAARDLAVSAVNDRGEHFWRLFRNRLRGLAAAAGRSDFDSDGAPEPGAVLVSRYLEQVVFGSTRRSAAHLSGAVVAATDPAWQLGFTERLYTAPRLDDRPLPGGALSLTGYLERRADAWALGATLRPSLVARAPQVVPIGSLVRPSLELGPTVSLERRWQSGVPLWEVYPGVDLNYQIWGVMRLGVSARGHLPDGQRGWTDGYSWSDLQLYAELPLPF